MDKYDKAVEALRAVPDDKFLKEVTNAWYSADHEHDLGCLFQFVSPSGNSEAEFGCLTMVRSGRFAACTPDLTERIRNDLRLPTGVESITKADLGVFAEWQRVLDREIRTPNPEAVLDARD